MEKTFLNSLFQVLFSFSGWTAYGAILLVLLICGLGVPIPEDITLVIAGFLASSHKISLWGAMLCGFIGVLIGDIFLFFLGRKFGKHIFQHPFVHKFFKEKRIKKAQQKVLRNSKFICFTARFLPGLRAPIYLTVGSMKVSPLVFLILDGLAALISVPFWVYVGWYFGGKLNWQKVLLEVSQFQHYFLIGALAFILLYILFKKIWKDKEKPEKL